MFRSLAFAGLALAALLPSAASAQSLYGSASIITNRNCPQAVDQVCVVGARNFTQFAGGMSTGLNTTAATMPGGASGAARAVFGAGYLPTVGVYSSAGAATRTGATVTAFRSFTYQGDVAIDLALNGVLHYQDSGTGTGATGIGDIYGTGIVTAVIGIMRLSDFAGFNAQTTASDIVSSSNAFPDCNNGAIAAINDTFHTEGAGSHNLTIGLSAACAGGAITLNRGDTFVVVATLGAISNRGDFIDAMNTFGVEIDDAHTFVSGTQTLADPVALRANLNGAAVPEPATWAMLIAGFGGVGALLRARRRAAAVA